jgi:peptidoglycan hydrolase-like protein with peptidoglycan-binding domain
MFFASKVACSGIVFLLMTPWISGPRPTPLDSGATLDSETPEGTPGDDVKEMQQTLQDEGHYQGKVDGVLGLRTRASIRGFQRAERLPVTGQLDIRTAGKLGVRPEVRGETSDEASQNKPSAGIKWARGSRRVRVTPRKPVKESVPTVPPA